MVSTTQDSAALVTLMTEFEAAWNQHDAKTYAALFAEDRCPYSITSIEQFIQTMQPQPALT